ncbi:helix-turn-helix domain-containing protein [Fangia hongkongensis]|uniref:helix-turn-helix domain-containing protein n=1 Tax=Fangia hongkongensis TaxID=270495 RepID=UPI0003765A78|nr:helix-turn-helix transcriptional regulator [Fangia hongkongensis]
MSILANNLKEYMNQNNIGLRKLAKHIGMSHSTLSRIINKPPQKLQPITKRKIAKFIGVDFEELCSHELNTLLLKKNDYKVGFIDFSGKSTNESIEVADQYTFAINVRNDDYSPLFPKGSILFFSNEPAYQNDICLINYNNKLLLCAAHNAYRLELELVDLHTNKKFTTIRDNVKAVLMKSLNPK